MTRGSRDSAYSSSYAQLATAGLLMVCLMVSRWWLGDWPNFKPVAGFTILAGFLFHDWRLRWAVPLASILLTDFLLGFPEPFLVWGVYACWCLNGWLGYHLQCRWSRLDTFRQRFLWSGATVLAANVVFFLGTNLAVWQLTSWYPATFAGLVACYVNALPFAANSLASDLLFAGLPLGLMSLYSARQLASRRAVVTAS